MSELDIKREVISKMLEGLSKNEVSLNEENDNAFDVEQAACACCCMIMASTGATILCW